MSFRNHITCKHNYIVDRPNQAVDVCDAETAEDDSHAANEVNEDLFDAQRDFDRQEDAARRANPLCILKFKEKGHVLQTIVNSFVENTTDIVKNSIRLLNTGVRNCLRNVGIDFAAVPKLPDLFDKNSCLANPFNGIDKEKLQYRYYKEELNLVVSA